MSDLLFFFFFFNDTATTEIYTLSLHDALPIPTALAMVAALTTPYRERHPNVQFTIWSRTSVEILELLDNLEIDAGITYLGNEPVGRVNTVPLYRERYRLLT